ncbi:gem-associated protein 2 [Plutella xylostella]|uniref:gem-associated protein 2 n=1 Tax=Plutella xylostella TaxID=51655 RepID=UPI002032A0FA|nr:gem-associated protein 2 [Plutella xylostella]
MTSVEDADSLVIPCLQIDPNVELKEVPTTGEEYLLKVMKERQKCVVVTKCNKDISKFAKNQSRFVVEPECTKSAPDALKPTLEWQNIQVADFSEVRMYISRMRAKKSEHKIQEIDIEENHIVSWKQFFEESSPTLSCVFGLKQAYFDNGLEMLTNSLNSIKPGETITPKTGQWIYAFLACLTLPLLSDTISILRNLARRCAEIRSHIKAEDENAIAAVAPLNVFICLISRYFRQIDLADK